MVLKFYPKKDATIYERFYNRNTGLDAILELVKTVDGSTVYNSRILIDFDLVSGSGLFADIAALGIHPLSCSYTLKLYTTEPEEIPLDYTLECLPLAQTWSMGIGRYANSPATTDGVSWRYAVGTSDTTSAWPTASYPTNTTGSWNVYGGGGVWYTSSTAATHSFSYRTTDVSFDVTSIVSASYVGTFPTASGFIIKKQYADETSLFPFQKLQFFSRDTHTVWAPVLEVGYDDSVYTGSLPTVDTSAEYVINPSNLLPSYREGTTALIRIATRPRYPALTFSTSSLYLTTYRLPSGSQYAVYSAHSDDIVIDFSNNTALSSDDVSSYFKLRLDYVQPERYYRVLFKVPISGSSDYVVHDGHWIFKVER